MYVTIQPILDKYGYVIIDTAIFCITSCQLAAKIFDNIPPALPRTATFIYDFGGVLFLTDQVKNCIKHSQDLYRIYEYEEWNELVPTAAKVAMAAFDVVFTVTTVTGSVISAYGYPDIAIGMIQTLRPFTMAHFFTGILMDFYNFNRNEFLIQQLNADYEQTSRIIGCFNEAIHLETSPQPSPDLTIALLIIRQLSWLSVQQYVQGEEVDREKLYNNIANKNIMTTSNLGLIVLGRFFMGITKAYPNTVADYSGRWFISTLYGVRSVWYASTL